MWCRRFTFNEINNVDCAFTSPPYFSTEEYNKGGEHEEDQSWFKFNEYEKWRDDFYLPVSLNSHKSLSENGFLFVNIMNLKRLRVKDIIVVMN